MQPTPSTQRRTLPLLLLAVALLLPSLLLAADDAASSDKPFAERRIVLQISDADPSKQTLVLNVASNLLKHYGQDKVDIEIVAFGPGLRLLFAENSNAPRIERLAGSGVRFAACNNTIRKMSSILGHTPDLNPRAVHVSAGVVRIIDLASEGYFVIKP